MEKMERDALQAAKEITVKFIEAQRISPANFEEIFPVIYRVVLHTILNGHKRLLEEDHP